MTFIGYFLVICFDNKFYQYFWNLFHFIIFDFFHLILYLFK